MKKYLFILVTILLMALLTACGTATSKDNANEGSSTGQEMDKGDNSESLEGTDGASSGKVDPPREEMIREEVIYIGLADNHTIEVNKDGEPIVLQIDESLLNDVDFGAIDMNTPVIIEYYVLKIDDETSQNILTGFQVKE